MWPCGGNGGGAAYSTSPDRLDRFKGPTSGRERIVYREEGRQGKDFVPCKSSCRLPRLTHDRMVITECYLASPTAYAGYLILLPH